MINYLNIRQPNLVYTHVNKVGGMFTNYYCYEKELPETGRDRYHSNKTWLKSYKDIKNNKISVRNSKDSFNFLVLSLTARLKDGNIELYNGSQPLREKESIYYGQVFTPLKNINSYKMHYLDVDLSLNSFKALDCSDYETIKLIDIRQGDHLSEFLSRNSIKSKLNSPIAPIPKNTFRHFRGYNDSIPNRFLESPISCLRTIKETEFINLSSTCYRWEEIVDSIAPKSVQNTEKSMLVDFKTEIDSEKLLAWVDENFRSVFKTLANDMGKIQLIDFNLIFHPPISTGMQFETEHSFISPRKGINNKVIDEIVIRIPKSIIREAQKALEIEITSGTSLHKYDSIKNSDLFHVYTNTGIETPEMETDFKILTFEEVTKLSFPDKDFKIAFKIPSELLSEINDNKEYKVKVRLTDFTAERSIQWQQI